ncbi:hypothetical protein [Nocardia macrotermitis]|uniref:Uncharacterized protein n=1 Tax=Nocardia macrotermitis TaxID=2585198 RepID=A0A7K0D4L7_9NOCA|nr:hypothetical protein [Nocardia macrotermitis]MQY20693.1 hypothetical protein [Nocardia macrotermitis]
METSSGRRSLQSRAITAVIFGFFGMMWFNWGQEAPPEWLRIWLDTGAVIATLVGITGAVICFRSRTADTPSLTPAARRRYWIVVAIEFTTGGALAVVLSMTGHPTFVPVAVAGVVGTHFYALATPLNSPGARPLSVVTCLIALAALIVGLSTTVAPSTIVGPGFGIVLTGYAVLELAPAARHRTDRLAPAS